MNFLKIFNKFDKKQNKTLESNKISESIGSMPQVGKQPALPQIPKMELQTDKPQVKDPSAASLNASNQILNSKK